MRAPVLRRRCRDSRAPRTGRWRGRIRGSAPSLVWLLLLACGEGPVVVLDVPLPQADASAPADGLGTSIEAPPDGAADVQPELTQNEMEQQNDGEYEDEDESDNDGEGNCVLDDDCSDEDEPLCDSESGQCAECLVDDDCGDPQQSVCHTEERECVTCRSDAQCLLGETCDVEDGECESVEDSD